MSKKSTEKPSKAIVAIVIGAGIAGMAAAIRLKAKGYDVTVFESNSYPGGKLTEIRKNGYRFDAGPSLFTMPHLVEELFDLSDMKANDYFEYQKLDTICQYFYEDGTEITAFAEPKKFAKEIEEKTGVSQKKILQHLKKSAELYDITAPVFLENSLHKSDTYFKAKTLKAILYLPRIQANTIMHKLNKKQFKNPKIVQLFNRYATYNGSDPYKAPATLNIIPHLEHNLGAYFPKGGMHSITKSIYKLAQSIGVKFEFNTGVERILVEKKQVIGVEIQNDKEIKADIVVSNMDVFHTYKKLLPDVEHPTKILSQEKSSSGLIFYWGIKKTFPKLDLHNIFFSENYKEEFEHIFDTKTIYKDPTIYLNISSKYNKEDAPKGCENWFVMINTPNNQGQDWDVFINQSRAHVLSKLSRMLGEDIEPLIACESVLDPRLIESRTSSHLGALYGNSSNNKMAAFMRHSNFSNKIDNLYFCGGSVHPGGGIPLCLLSAKIVGDLV